jgi:hypothetical protein
MTSNLDDQQITDEEYIARVLRYRPSSLVPWIAEVGAQYADIGSWLDGDYMRFTPWALADIARISLVLGSEFLRDAARDDLLWCADGYRNLLDAELGDGDPGALEGFLLRMGHQQTFQNAIKNEIGRSTALFEQTTSSRELKVIKPGWDRELLGCSLSQYLGTGFLVYAVARRQKGRFSTHWFNEPALATITSEIPIPLMRQVLDEQFTGNRDFFRDYKSETSASPLRRFAYNPLLGKPLVSGIGNTRLVPVPAQVIRKISPLGVWYAGFDRWRHSFAEDVGDLFEQYVGQLLGIIPDAQVHKEIVYDKGQQRSVDWIVVWDNVVLLVEVKSARSTEPIRMGTSEAWDQLATKLGTAYRQIARTDERIAEGHARFSHIPRNLPRIGLIVTLESFPFLNSGPIRSRADFVPSVPLRACSAELLEWLVCLPDRSVGEYLYELMNDPSREGWDVLGEDQAGIEFAPNPVLDQAWNSYLWAPSTSGEASRS